MRLDETNSTVKLVKKIPSLAVGLFVEPDNRIIDFLLS